MSGEFWGEWIYGLFCERLRSGWLVDCNGKTAIDLAEGKLAKFTQSQPNFISIATSDPIEFISTLMAGLRLGLPIFLCNPQWGATEWERVNILTAGVDRNRHRDRLMIPTGGSSGEIKFAIHTWQTLSASVAGFQEFYALEQINCICILPLYHVSGLMQLMRSLITNGRLLIADYHQFCEDLSGSIQHIEIDSFFISLVPTQLSKLLDLQPRYLAKFQTILLGGAAANVDLLTRSRLAGLPLALTYGMTETASQIASLKPAEFLAGNNSCGKVLPHGEVKILRSIDDAIGLIQIRSTSLMLGYFPDENLPSYFDTDDLGSIDDRGYLTIVGRNSGKIISGGENVFPIEVVNAIMATGLVADAWVLGVPDPYWGQIVVAIYIAGDLPISVAELNRNLATKISKYKIPKRWISVANIPRNYLGKVAIQEVEKIAKIDSNRDI